ncbi:ATP dependent DNA ligase [Methanococcus vannielii SB]|uniref:ATP dependent DNA ligase n=1 Tax=Methanococcus vannielii (strain ATCC 35089 / DSM 1224 / JCM 13029 / OCM 148 / SB) TaxID=406327 RepID=A6URY9_METVS|nr:RNA ligase [Methanococcus vannielii]ABR55261.1 ATP dependent DNA ligase [Methanococcus vannielii SB]
MNGLFSKTNNKEFKEIVQKISKRLNLNPNDLEKGFERKIITKYEYNDKKYLCFKKKLRHIERGTIVFLNDNFDYFCGYPKIKRAMMLKASLDKYFDKKIAIEEKLDGYNIRIIKFEDEILAVTRGGKICPFTTKKVKKYLKTTFLDDYPNLMLCGEMIGLNNPYVNQYYIEAEKDYENLGFYIFDIRERETNIPYSISKKEELFKKYEIPHVKPIIIDKKDISKLWEILNTLNENKKEGVILKDPEMLMEPLKYTTQHTQCNDLSIAFKYTYDIGIDFMFSRIVREGYQSFEMSESKEEELNRAEKLGKSIFLPMIQTIKDVSEGITSKECFELFFESEPDFLEFMNYLKKMHVPIIIESKEIMGKIIKVRICRIYNATTDKIKSHLEGNLW